MWLITARYMRLNGNSRSKVDAAKPCLPGPSPPPLTRPEGAWSAWLASQGSSPKRMPQPPWPVPGSAW